MAAVRHMKPLLYHASFQSWCITLLYVIELQNSSSSSQPRVSWQHSCPANITSNIMNILKYTKVKMLFLVMAFVYRFNKFHFAVSGAIFAKGHYSEVVWPP